MKSKFRASKASLALFLAGLLWGSPAPLITDVAWAEQLFSIGDLTFACDSCSVSEDGSCILAGQDENVTLPCSKLSELLLLKAVNGAYDGQHPSHLELRKLLLSDQGTEEQVKYALKLLTRTEGGRATLRYIAPHVLDRHAKHLPGLIMSSDEAGDVWDAFWQLPETHGMKLTDGVRAAMIVKSNKLSIERLLDSIADAPFEEHDAKLKFYENFFRENNHPAADKLAEIRTIRSACMELAGSETIPDQCSKTALLALPAEYQVYFSRLQLKLMEGFLERTRPRGAALFSQAAQTNFNLFRSNAIADSLLKELRAINDKLGDKNRARYITDVSRPLLETYARDNRELAFEVARLYVSAAHEAFNSGKLNDGFHFMRGSFAVFPDVLPERVSLLSALQKSGAFDQNPALKEQLYSVTDLSASTQLERRSVKPYLWAAAGGLCVLFLALLFFSLLPRRGGAGGASDDVLTEDERIELSEILGQFGFLERPNKAQLATFFRERAKELHPDTGQHPDADAFANLTERYERVKVLIEKQL